MLRKAVGLVMVLVLAGTVAAEKAPKAPPKATGKEVKAKVIKVDTEKKTLTVSVDGKPMFLAIGKGVQFVGPKGGVSDKGIKDDRLKAGAEVTLVMDETGKTLKTVKLPMRARKPKGK